MNNTDHLDSVAITFRDVQFEYSNGVQAVGGLDLEALKGEIIAIVGPSGCGKSTLLHLAAGLKFPSGGTVSRAPVGGDEQGLAMLFQQDTVLPWLTARENVALHYRLRGRRARRRADAKVTELLGLVGLSDFADAYPRELSGGMRRRIAFLSAVAAEPRILLLDEPFSALDEPTRVELHQEIYEVVRRMEITVLLVTHDLAEAATLCERVLMLTSRPATLAREFPIPFGSDRSMLELREDPLFLKIYGELWHELRQQLGTSSATSAGGS